MPNSGIETNQDAEAQPLIDRRQDRTNVVLCVFFLLLFMGGLLAIGSLLILTLPKSDCDESSSNFLYDDDGNLKISDGIETGFNACSKAVEVCAAACADNMSSALRLFTNATTEAVEDACNCMPDGPALPPSLP